MKFLIVTPLFAVLISFAASKSVSLDFDENNRPGIGVVPHSNKHPPCRPICSNPYVELTNTEYEDYGCYNCLEEPPAYVPDEFNTQRVLEDNRPGIGVVPPPNQHPPCRTICSDPNVYLSDTEYRYYECNKSNCLVEPPNHLPDEYRDNIRNKN